MCSDLQIIVHVYIKVSLNPIHVIPFKNSLGCLSGPHANHKVLHTASGSNAGQWPEGYDQPTIVSCALMWFWYRWQNNLHWVRHLWQSILVVWSGGITDFCSDLQVTVSLILFKFYRMMPFCLGSIFGYQVCMTFTRYEAVQRYQWLFHIGWASFSADLPKYTLFISGLHVVILLDWSE